MAAAKVCHAELKNKVNIHAENLNATKCCLYCLSESRILVLKVNSDPCQTVTVIVVIVVVVVENVYFQYFNKIENYELLVN